MLTVGDCSCDVKTGDELTKAEVIDATGDVLISEETCVDEAVAYEGESEVTEGCVVVVLTLDMGASLVFDEAVMAGVGPSVFFTGHDCLLMLVLDGDSDAAACLRHH